MGPYNATATSLAAAFHDRYPGGFEEDPNDLWHSESYDTIEQWYCRTSGWARGAAAGSAGLERVRNGPSVGGSFAARWARIVLKRCSSERGEREKRFYGDGKGERRRTAF